MPSRAANTPWAESRRSVRSSACGCAPVARARAAAFWGVSPSTSATPRSATMCRLRDRSQATLICITTSWGVGVMLLSGGFGWEAERASLAAPGVAQAEPHQALRPIQLGHGADGIPHADRQQGGESAARRKLVSQLPAWPVESARVFRVAQDADLAEGGLREPPVLEAGGVAANPGRQRDALRIVGIDAGHVAQTGEGGEPPVGEVPFRLRAEPAHRVAESGGDGDERLADLPSYRLGPRGRRSPKRRGEQESSGKRTAGAWAQTWPCHADLLASSSLY